VYNGGIPRVYKGGTRRIVLSPPVYGGYEAHSAPPAITTRFTVGLEVCLPTITRFTVGLERSAPGPIALPFNTRFTVGRHFRSPSFPTLMSERGSPKGPGPGLSTPVSLLVGGAYVADSQHS